MNIREKRILDSVSGLILSGNWKVYASSNDLPNILHLHSISIHSFYIALSVENWFGKKRFIQSDACVCFHNLLESDEITTRWQLSISLTLSSEHLWEFPEIFRSQSDFVIENYISHSSITCALKRHIMSLNSSYNKIIKLRQFNYFCTTCS